MSYLGNIFIVGSVLKAGITFPLAFHYFGGLRHVFWDNKPEALQNDQVEATSKVVYFASIVTSIGAALL